MVTSKHMPKILIIILGLLLTAAWLSGCSSKKDLKDVKDPFYEQWRVKAEESKGHSAVEPPAVDEEPFEIAGKQKVEALEPEVERSLPNHKLSLKMNSIEVSVLLRALAKAANQNIILNEKVSGQIDINIHQAPWDQVFLGILRTHNLSYDWNRALVPEWERLRVRPAGCAGFCTMLLSRRVIHETRKHNLDVLKAHFRIESGYSHHADADVETEHRRAI